ncbi:Polyprenol-phosphate-mannose-dependent alpha-(1-2)-phosphatidylinositol mannoside mannosyltransferase [Micromonospora sp. MW-13]|uniref:glycosyltransferase 87 family protein n=1 Tax=Micromonospora sp. MW-13 TaxID=2094022 RepID=UPI000E43F378|nr:glycosyltransferase 87 family protein [Micromonospora sp. MW-13]RGC68687.1 Polyprenol-phosphate-mannose-dependent alpha-(1-2)-phosphatidylinositol mannoside mannosyltransferase [Micromonospora sp. MW-13]
MPATVGRRMDRLAPVRRVTRATRGVDRRTVVRAGVVAAVAYAAWFAIGAFGRPYNFFDMKIYHGAVVWWANGNELYDFIAPSTTLGFTYPPFGGLVMLPMALVPVEVAGWLNALASIAALALVLAGLLRPVVDRLGWPLWFTVGIATPMAVAIEPGRETLGFGQVNLLLFALIMADLIGLRWRAKRGTRFDPADGPLRRFVFSGAWAGVGIGLATAVKLTPALFIVYLMITRQWRAAATAVGTAIGVTLAGFALVGTESRAYFGGVLWQTERVGAADMTPNQSLAGLLARLYDSIETPGLLWLSFSVLVLALGLSRAVSARGDGDELTAFTLVGLTANVISPISWSHHLVWVIPAIIVLADAAVRRREASRGLVQRPGQASSYSGLPGVNGLRPPIWYPTLTGLRHGVAAVGLYLLFLISPIWPYEHQLPEVSHYQDGLFGALMENSLAVALIVLVAALPWRPGAEPAFYADRFGRAALVNGRR